MVCRDLGTGKYFTLSTYSHKKSSGGYSIIKARGFAESDTACTVYLAQAHTVQQLRFTDKKNLLMRSNSDWSRETKQIKKSGGNKPPKVLDFALTPHRPLIVVMTSTLIEVIDESSTRVLSKIPHQMSRIVTRYLGDSLTLLVTKGKVMELYDLLQSPESPKQRVEVQSEIEIAGHVRSQKNDMIDN